MKERKLGDTFPGSKNPKWGSMVAGDSILSDEWHSMEHSAPHTSEKWVDMEHSTPRMSEKWVDMDAGSTQFSDKWHEMRQERRDDPYSMNPGAGDRSETGMKKQSDNPMKNDGHGTYTIRDSEGKTGKEL